MSHILGSQKNTASNDETGKDCKDPADKKEKTDTKYRPICIGLVVITNPRTKRYTLNIRK